MFYSLSSNASCNLANADCPAATYAGHPLAVTVDKDNGIFFDGQYTKWHYIKSSGYGNAASGYPNCGDGNGGACAAWVKDYIFYCHVVNGSCQTDYYTCPDGSKAMNEQSCPQSNCPAIGTTLKSTTCTDVPEINICAGGTCQLTNKDGCGFDSPITSVQSYASNDGKFCVTYTGTANGNNVSNPPAVPGITQFNDTEEPAPKPIQQEQTFNSTADSQTDTAADGTVTDTDTTTETVKKADTVIDTNTEYIYEDGKKIEKITTTTTVINPDGSKTVTTAVSYNQTTGKKIDWNKVTGQVKVTDPVVETSGTTTTKTFNTSGKITSSSSVGTNGAGTSNGTITGGNNGTTGDKTGGSDGVENSGDDDKPDEQCTNCSFTGQGPKDGGYYTPTDKTYDSVITAFKDKVSGTGAIAAAQNFFTISLPSGACPVWSAQIPYINFNLVIDQQCSPVMTSIWPYIQAVLLVVAGFVAFRWAFL